MTQLLVSRKQTKIHVNTYCLYNILILIFLYSIKRVGGKRYQENPYASTVEFDQEVEWKELLKRQYTYTAVDNPEKVYLMIPIHQGHQLYQRATIVTTNLERKDWIMACHANHVHKDTRMWYVFSSC